MFLVSSLLIFACDYILAAYSKNSVLLIPALLYLIALFGYFPCFYSGKKAYLLIPYAALTASLIYGILGQLTASVAIVDYYIVIAQSICSFAVLTLLSLSGRDKSEEVST